MTTTTTTTTTAAAAPAGRPAETALPDKEPNTRADTPEAALPPPDPFQ